jgi:hypothetical protein
MDNCEGATRPNARASRFVQVCFVLIMRLQSGIHAWARRGGVAAPELGWARYDDSRGLCHSLVCFQGLLVTVVGLDRFAGHKKPLCITNYQIKRQLQDAALERQRQITALPRQLVPLMRLPEAGIVIMARAAERKP